MSTRKKTTEAFKYDFGASHPGKVKLSANDVDSEEAEQNSKRLLKLQCYMGMEKMHLGIATEVDWFSLQLRLSVGDQMVQLLEKCCTGFSPDDLATLKDVMDGGYKVLEEIARRINDRETKEFYATVDERQVMLVALNLADELEDLLIDFYGKLVIYKLYRDTRDHLVKMHP